MPELRYEKYLVGFLDVLGFSEMCMAGEKSAKEKAKVQNFYQLCRQIPEDFRRIPGKDKIETMVLSDSIVIAINISESDFSFTRLAHFLTAIGKFQFHLAKNHFWLRGGVAVGNLQIDTKTKHIVGPALIRAVRMEKEQAKYPRVVLDLSVLEESELTSAPEFRREVNGALGTMTSPLFEWRHYFDSLSERRLPQDVPFFIDYLRCENPKEILSVAEAAAKGLRGDIRHYEKHRWTADYILASTAQLTLGVGGDLRMLKELLG